MERKYMVEDFNKILGLYKWNGITEQRISKISKFLFLHGHKYEYNRPVYGVLAFLPILLIVALTTCNLPFLADCSGDVLWYTSFGISFVLACLVQVWASLVANKADYNYLLRVFRKEE